MELKTTFQKLSEEIKSKISEQLKTKEVQEMVAKIKDAQDSGRFEVVISTGDVDRMGEVINPAGWDLEFYKMNPVVLWAHDYMSLPIGITESIEIKDGKLVATGKFAPADANLLAQQVRKLYDLGMQRATSVGYLEKERKDNNISKAELLEWSFVSVPANPFALSTLRQSGIDTEVMITKGIIVPVKAEPKEGDPCTMDDGSDGVMKPNDNGELVCTPKEGAKPAPETEGDYIIIRVKDPDYFDPDSFRTIEISADEGIKATIGCKKGEYEDGKCQIGTEVQRYLFDKEKWTLEKAEAWVKDHEKSAKQDEGDLAAKIGAELTQMQSEIDAAIIAHTKNIIGLLSQKQNAILEGKKLQGDKPGDGANLGREPAGLKELEEFIILRTILQKADIALEDGLKRLKERIRSSSN
jgi:polyhydroxyalkanoate synthesis regulator phasin